MKQSSPRFVLLLTLAIPAAVDAATLTVNSLADNTTAADGLVTLREAMLAAEVDGTTDLGQSGAGADLIRVTLDGTIAPLTRLPAITTAIAVVGNGVDRLSVSAESMAGVGLLRVFDVRGGALTLDSLTITAGLVLGFRGGDCQLWSGCGGGSAALGGLVAVNSGALVISNARLSQGTVVGGSGGSHTPFVEQLFGGGGGAGLGGRGATPASDDGGTGGPATPGGLATPAGGNGVDGAGGGGGTSGQLNPVAGRGGNGGFGAGGGGGGVQLSQFAATGGNGGYGAGGGGRGGAQNQEISGSGGNGGAFGGVGGFSSIPLAGGSFPIGVGGGGGGGAGLGGCVFARNAQVEIANVEFVACAAFGGYGGENNTLNQGGSGQGKGGAVFLHSSVQRAILANVRFSRSIATGSSGSGLTPGVLSDTADVFGTARKALFANGFE